MIKDIIPFSVTTITGPRKEEEHYQTVSRILGGIILHTPSEMMLVGSHVRGVITEGSGNPDEFVTHFVNRRYAQRIIERLHTDW